MAYGKKLGAGNFAKGFRLFSGEELTNAFTKMLEGGIGRRIAIVAKAGGGKATATALDRSLNRVDTVATAADSVLLPKAIAGSILLVTNNGANSLNMFAQGTDTLNGVATGTAIALAATKTYVMNCHENGKWFGGPLG